MFETFNENATANKLRLVNYVDNEITVFADAKMILSILQNIVSNSIKYTQPGGSISVTANKKDDNVIVEIKDTGIGMSKEVIAKLFTPQIKTLTSARGENKGAGIGLLLVKVFIEKNNGTLWVKSEENIGTSFYFTLPEKQ